MKRFFYKSKKANRNFQLAKPIKVAIVVVSATLILKAQDVIDYNLSLSLLSKNKALAQEVESKVSTEMNTGLPKEITVLANHDSKEIDIDQHLKFESSNSNSNLLSNGDCDGDGIPDAMDIDDDNDGIPDVEEEMLCEETDFPNPTTGVPERNRTPPNWTKISSAFSTPDISSLTRWRGQSTRRWYNSSGASVASVPEPAPSVESFITVTTETAGGTEAVSTSFTATEAGALSIMFGGFGSTVSGGVANAMPGYFQTVTVTSSTGTVQYTGQVPWDVQWHERIYEYGAGLVTITIDNANAPAGTRHTTNVSIAQENMACIEVVDLDSDNDGRPNRIDLDSDNDGCSDAVEAGVIPNANLSDGIDSANSNKLIEDAWFDFNDPNTVVGANGLQNEVETTAESGIVGYTSTYDLYALNGGVGSCSDWDGDGIADMIDSDDDNDGVPDVQERDCEESFVNIDTSRQIILNGDFDMYSMLPDGPGRVGFLDDWHVPNGTVQGLSPDYFHEDGWIGDPTFDFGDVTPSPQGGGFVGGVNDIVQPEHEYVSTNLAYRLFPNVTYNLNFYLGATANGTNQNLNGSTGGYTNGDFVVYGFANRHVEFPFSSASGPPLASTNPIELVRHQVTVPDGTWTLQSLQFTVPTEIRSIIMGLETASGYYLLDGLDLRACNIVRDTDNDGVPDKFDLDCDNDGCSDAEEAGVMPNTNLSTGVDIGNGSQSLASAWFDPDNATTVVGANGMQDEVETGVDSEMINYTSTYESMALDASIGDCEMLTECAAGTGELDSDLDGVSDICDVDDDNDGILDVDESNFICLNATSATVITPTVANSNEAIGTVVPEGSAANNSNSAIVRSGAVLVLTLDQELPVGSVVNIHAADVRTDNSASIDITDEGTGLLSITPADWTTDDIIHVFSLTITAPTDQITFTGVSGSGTYIDGIESCRIEDLDADGDGIINRLDPDSDGDGCFDALEAGHGESVNGIGQVDGPFGINGLDNDVENADTIGTETNYTLLESTPGSLDFLSSEINTQCCGTVDTDGDGIFDLCDIDDDNDGVPDSIEGCEPSELTLLNNLDGEFEGLASVATSGGVANGIVEPGAGWIRGTSNPDAHLPPIVGAGVAEGTPASPQGGVFVGAFGTKQLNGSGNPAVPGGGESFYGNITGLVVGRTYELTFYQANAGYAFVPPDPNDPIVGGSQGYWRVEFGQDTLFSPEMVFLGYGNQVWQLVTMQFTASSTTQRLEFRANSGPSNSSFFAYMGIDDVQLRETECLGIDSDGDGTPNHLDLDSDNDGCSDAEEAGVMPNANLSMGVDPANGNQVLSNAWFDPANATTMVGANGLQDEVETSVDSDDINYMSTYDNFALDNSVMTCMADCVPSIITVGDVTCESDGSWSFSYLSSGDSISSSLGTVDTMSGRVIGLTPGEDVILFAYTQGGDCTDSLSISAPTACPLNCVLPDLSVGQGSCDGIDASTYSVSYTETTGATISVNPGATINANGTVTAPLNTDIVITATNPSDANCVVFVTVTSPMDCMDTCNTALISMSGPVCNGQNASYIINYISPLDVTVSVEPTSAVLSMSSTEIEITTGVDVTVRAVRMGCDTVEIPVNSITCPECRIPITTVSEIDCNGSNWEFSFNSNAMTVSSSSGTISGNRVTGLSVGTSVDLIASNGAGCNDTISVMGPSICPVNCVQPNLSLGQPICVGADSFDVSYTHIMDMNITVTGGVDKGNNTIRAPIGNTVIVTATNPSDASCTQSASVNSPTNCDNICENALISVSAPVCGVADSFVVSYAANTNVEVSVNGMSLGTGPGSVSIEVGTDALFVAVLTGCTPDSITISGNVDCPECRLPITTVSEIDCNGSNWEFSFNTNAMTVSSSSGTISGNMVTGLTVGSSVDLIVSNGTDCNDTMTVIGPTTCPVECDQPGLSAGQPICLGTDSFALAYSVDTGFTVTVTGGADNGQGEIRAALGNTIVLTAVNSSDASCTQSISVESPDCDNQCENALISISAPRCGEADSFVVNYTADTSVEIFVNGISLGKGSGMVSLQSGTDAMFVASLTGCRADSVTVSGDIVCPECDELVIKVFIEGAYDTSTGLMSTLFNELHMLPGQDHTLNPRDPLGLFDMNSTPSGQPYSRAPWNNIDCASSVTFGDTTLDSSYELYPSTVVDWVLVSVREGDSLASSQVWREAGLLHEDGSVTFPNSCGCLNFQNEGNYYIVIEHRNHLPIMSQIIRSDGSSSMVYDFTTQDSWKHRLFGLDIGTGQVQINGLYMMAGGNAKTDTYEDETDINSFDLNRILNTSNQLFEYLEGDVDFNADINSNDVGLHRLRSNTFTLIPFD